ncbi:hypothetical protein NE237_033170 [Protea cynaroides]|uniref:Uncharacterized protein n=1 Tax=Protea cynaroides TaxID=273540 RepID=A0A9Q0R3S5_9MAGN|nr:hypothetical protein NE237_033170 [Protea cynaroides]
MMSVLELFKGLPQRGHRISFISTPRNIERLSKLPPNLFSLITFVKLTLPPVENLSEEAEATSDVPLKTVQYLKKAFDGLEEPFARFVESSGPNWAPPIVAKFGVPSAFFCIFNGSFFVFWGSPWVQMIGEPKQFTVPHKWIPSPSNLAFRHYEILKSFHSLSENASGQRKGYVVYVAFGTEAALSGEEMHEIDLGLELSGLLFFWGLRMPVGSEVSPSSMLPSGFENRTQDQGFIYSGWAPQRRILSVIESLTMSCPLVLLPLSADQPLVARLLESKNIAVEIQRDEQDGSFTRESVANSLRLVIVESEGELHKAKAREMREVFGDKVMHDRYMDEFDRYLKNYGC